MFKEQSAMCIMSTKPVTEHFDVHYTDVCIKLLLNVAVMVSRHFFRDRDICQDTGVKTRDEPRHSRLI